MVLCVEQVYGAQQHHESRNGFGEVTVYSKGEVLVCPAQPGSSSLGLCCSWTFCSLVKLCVRQCLRSVFVLQMIWWYGSTGVSLASVCYWWGQSLQLCCVWLKNEQVRLIPGRKRKSNAKAYFFLLLYLFLLLFCPLLFWCLATEIMPMKTPSSVLHYRTCNVLIPSTG